MKIKNLCFAALFSAAVIFSAQAQDIPQPSPKAMVMQTVGLTDITLEYSSPAVAGREIWGKLVPYNELWRTGANAASKITFSKDVSIEGKAVPAGTYTLLTIPAKDEWTIILNKDITLGGTRGYKEENDLLRFKVKPVASTMRERFAILVTDFNNDEATVSLEWEKLKVPFKVQVNTHAQTLASINATLNNSWRAYANSARYLLDNNKDLDQALTYINTSISLNSQWFNNWIKARILAEKKQMKEAIKFAKVAKELGDKDTYFFWKADVEKALAEWK
ncbi:MAG: DUF2911 domain-containing protein [Cytophagaceae bacterium]